MTTITGTLLDASGAGVDGVPVTARLVAAAGTLAAGGEIIRQASTTSGPGGAWSLNLTPTSALAYPAGAHYVVEADGRRWPITVPDTGTHELATVLIGTPDDRGVVGLTQTSADARYEQLAHKGAAGGYAGLDGTGKVPAAQLPPGSGGTVDPAGTVAAETAFGQASAAGAAVTYSRGDHTHGTPAAPTAASVGADAAGTAAAALAGHVAAGDPHPAYLTPAEGNAAYALAGHTHPGGGAGATFDLSGYGLKAASDDPVAFMGSSNLSNNTVHYTRIWVPAGAAITNLWVAVRAAGTHDGVTGPNQLALYDDAGNLVGTTADNPALWTAAGWRGGPLSGGPVAAQGAGRFVYLGALARGMTASPSIPFPASASDWTAFYAGPAGGNRRCFVIGATNAFPATINPAASGTPTGFVPLYGVS